MPAAQSSRSLVGPVNRNRPTQSDMIYAILCHVETMIQFGREDDAEFMISEVYWISDNNIYGDEFVN
jgi:hypothetical protein